MFIFVGNDLSTDVLQGTHPIPIRGQPVEPETETFRGWPADIQRFFSVFLWVSRSPGINCAGQHSRHGQADGNSQNEDDVLLHLKLRRPKIKVAAANKTAT